MEYPIIFRDFDQQILCMTQKLLLLPDRLTVRKKTSAV